MSYENIFREVEVRIEDKSFKLRKNPISSIFKFNNPPYIIIGASGSGKTTLSIDILRTYSKQCTKIYYITATEENSLDQGKPGDISIVPKVFRRKPTYENIAAIWNEMEQEYKAHTFDESKYTSILKKLCGEKLGTFLSDLDTERNKIVKEQEQVYNKKRCNENTAQHRDDGNAFYVECMCRAILSAVQTYGTEKLSVEDMLIVNSFVSERPRTILILDDATSDLKTLESTKKPVLYKGNSLPVSRAYSSILTDMLTRGRHMNALICMFLHSIDLVQKDLISNLILLDAEGAQKTINSKTFPSDMKKTIVALQPYVFRSEFKYHFLHINHNNHQYCVGKADIFTNPLELPETLEELVKAYDVVSKSDDSDEKNNLLELDDSDDDSDDEDDSNEDDD